MAQVNNDAIKRINELYRKDGTYARVARETGFSPSTVKKYVIQDSNEDTEEVEPIRYNKPLPPFDPSLFHSRDWGNLCVLTDEEIAKTKVLWKELIV